MAHMRDPWDGNQCSFYEFSFSSHENPIFHFLALKTVFLCEATKRKATCNRRTPIYKNG
jgi:hypothetical protein